MLTNIILNQLKIPDANVSLTAKVTKLHHTVRKRHSAIISLRMFSKYLHPSENLE